MSDRRRRLVDWLDERTGIRGITRSQLTEYLLPVTLNRWYSLGFVLLVFVALQFVTGFLLLIYYIPDARHAFESVHNVMNEIPYGWLIRLIHVHGANAMVIVLTLHMLSVVVMGSYKRPRELQWVTGCLLYFLALGLCFTGYVLPWSQLSFWATTVGMNIAGSVPLVGEAAQRYFQGGDVVGPPTLGRAYAFHVALLPLLLLGLVAVHLYLVRYAGISEPPSRHGRPAPKTLRFFPDFVVEDLAVSLGILALFAAVLFFMPHVYLPPEAFEKADPFSTPAHVKPEWYFLASYAALRLIPHKVLGILAQMLAVTALILLPFLDRGPRRHILDRPVFAVGVCLAVLGYVGLTVLGHLA